MEESAIVMASGLGTRMRPLTDHTPKPLLRVGAAPMIETVLEALRLRGVRACAVVTGYLGGQFAYLERKFPGTRLIANPDYERANNISSVYWAREFLRGGPCWVCEADLYVANPKVLTGRLPGSCYLGRLEPGRTEDWVFDTDSAGFITRVGKGGENRYMMTGFAFFESADAALLADIIETAYQNPANSALFWDEAVDRNLDRLRLRVRAVEAGDIIEIDTPDELAAARERYGGTAS